MDEAAARASGADLGLKCNVADSADVARCVAAAREAEAAELLLASKADEFPFE